MRPPAALLDRPATVVGRRRRGGLAAVALSAALLAGCGSSDDQAGSGTAGADRTGTASDASDVTFCDAIDDYNEAAKAGDRTSMAKVLSDTIEGLPEDDVQTVEAYVTALQGSPANGVSDGDGVEADSTEEAFRAYVADTCGDVELPEELDATTTTSPPPSEGGGSTDDTTVDGGPVGGGGDTGTGGGAGVP